MLEEEPVDATDSTTTGRYDKAYAIPTKQLGKKEWSSPSISRTYSSRFWHY